MDLEAVGADPSIAIMSCGWSGLDDCRASVLPLTWMYPSAADGAVLAVGGGGGGGGAAAAASDCTGGGASIGGAEAGGDFGALRLTGFVDRTRKSVPS